MEYLAFILLAILLAVFAFFMGQRRHGTTDNAPQNDANVAAMTGLKAQLELLAQQATTSQAQMAEQMRTQEAMLSSACKNNWAL